MSYETRTPRTHRTLMAAALALIAVAPSLATPRRDTPSAGARTLGSHGVSALPGPALPGRPTALAAGDVDGDGRVDVICAMELADGAVLQIRLGAMEPQAAAPVSVFLAHAPRHLVLGDFDADDLSDVAFDAGDAVRWLRGADGLARQGPPRHLGGRVTAIAAGDLGRPDGLADLAVVVERPAGPDLAILTGPRGALRADPIAIPLPPGGGATAIGDVDGDGRGDVAVAAGASVVLVRGSDPLGTATARIPAAEADGTIALADVDGDGEREIALVARDGAVAVLDPSSGAAVPSPRHVGSVALARGPAPGPIRARVSGSLGDDVVIAGSGGLWALTPAGLVRLGGGTEAVVICAASLNGDALTDLVTASASGSLKAHSSAFAAAFTVDTTADTPDAAPGNGACADAAGRCTLRAAIQESNALPGVDAIAFAIGSGAAIIAPGAALPAVTDPVVIDGTTQPGYAGFPLVELSGATAGAGATGLTVTAGSSTLRGLAINRWDGNGILLSGAGGNVVAACRLGTDGAGTTDLGNTLAGVAIEDSPGNLVGGGAADGNLLSGNETDGVTVTGTASTGNTIRGNLIGTDASGGLAIGNTLFGVTLDASGNVVGGTGPEDRNVISGNEGGVFLISDLATSQSNLVQGNLIGTDASGFLPLGNVANGIRIREAHHNTVGGTTEAARNVISANLEDGVFIRGRDPGDSAGNLIQGNFIGIDVEGTAALPNVFLGIAVRDADGNTLGGAGAGNVISGNLAGGVHLFGDSDTTLIQDNFIGTSPGGTSALGNGGDGILVEVSGTTISGNTVSWNTGAGVVVTGSGIRNVVSRGSYAANGGLAVDLSTVLPPNGPTPNDPGDGDAGPNGLQNHPVLATATLCGGATVVTGSLSSRSSRTYTLEVFASPACDASGRGEGTVFLGATNVTTNLAGQATFNVSLPEAPSGWVVAATATETTQGTSEHSACILVTDARAPEVPTLSWSGTQTLQWPAVPGATGYAVQRGAPQDLPALLTPATDSCRAWAGTATTTGPILTSTPPAGTFEWFLVVATNACGNGSAGNATGQPRILDSSGACR